MRKMLEAQHTRARASQRRVAGSQARFAITTLAMPASRSGPEIPRSRSDIATTSATIEMAATASTSRAAADHRPPGPRVRHLTGMARPAALSGAVTRPARSMVASITEPPIALMTAKKPFETAEKSGPAGPRADTFRADVIGR